MINLVSNTISKSEINELIKWLDQDETPRLTQGELVEKLQVEWASIIGTKYSVFVNSGSSAILLTLSALHQSGKLKNNKIIVPALSWATDVSSPMILNMDITLCDCNLQDLSCDLNMLEYLFKTQSPACFISVSVLGIPPNMKEIVNLCNKYDVILLEDNCESMGSMYGDKSLGTFGIASFYSLYFGHHLSCIEGGLINTNDEDLYNVLLCIRNHGWSRNLLEKQKEDFNQKWNIKKFDDLYTFYYAGFNFRSTDLQAFIAINQLKKLNEVSKKRYENYLLYKQLIIDNMFDLPTDNFISNFAFPILSYNRDSIIKRLNKNQVECRPLIAGSIGRQPFWIKKYGISQMKNADLIHNYGMYIPNNHEINNTDIYYISNITNGEK